MFKELSERAEALRGKKVEKGGDNMLVITNNGRDIALSEDDRHNTPLSGAGRWLLSQHRLRYLEGRESKQGEHSLSSWIGNAVRTHPICTANSSSSLMVKGIPEGEIKSILRCIQ